MNFTDLRNGIVENLKTVVDNVQEVFIFPEEMAMLQPDFPYVTMVFGEGEFDGQRRIIQSVSIIGIVKGENDEIPDKIITLKNEIFEALYNKEPKINFVSQNLTNLFAPFGLDAGIFPPYGGIRFECTIPNAIKNE